MFQDKVVYQIYPKSFMDSNGDGIGDIPGITSKLDYLADLGVDYLWLSPIHPSPQHDNGYDIADYYGVDPMFGSLEDYKQLIAKAGKRNIGILLDLVLNHTSDEHEWFAKSCQRIAPYDDYYVWTDTPNELIGFFSKSAWSYSEERGQYYLHLFDQHQPDLNWHNPAIREELCAMVNYWLDLGVQGFRLDVIDLIGKEPEKLITAKGPKFYDYLAELQEKTFGLGAHDTVGTKVPALTVGECWNASLDEARAMTGSKGLTQVFDFNHLTTTHGKDKWDQQAPDFAQVGKIVQQWQNAPNINRVVVMNNHDMPRLLSLWLDDGVYRYESATLLATFFGLLRGTQYIYQGEEIGLTNAHWESLDCYQDVETLNYYASKADMVGGESVGISADNAGDTTGTLTHAALMGQIMRVSRDNARTPMQWDSDQPHGGFTAGTPWLAVPEAHAGISVATDIADVDCENQHARSVYRYYQRLITYKKAHFATHIDKPIDEIGYTDSVWWYKKGKLTVVCNMTSSPTAVPNVIASKADASDRILFSNYPEKSEKAICTLRPYQAVVWEVLS